MPYLLKATGKPRIGRQAYAYINWVIVKENEDAKVNYLYKLLSDHAISSNLGANFRQYILHFSDRFAMTPEEKVRITDENQISDDELTKFLRAMFYLINEGYITRSK